MSVSDILPSHEYNVGEWNFVGGAHSIEKLHLTKSKAMCLSGKKIPQMSLHPCCIGVVAEMSGISQLAGQMKLKLSGCGISRGSEICFLCILGELSL